MRIGNSKGKKYSRIFISEHIFFIFGIHKMYFNKYALKIFRNPKVFLKGKYVFF